MEEDTPQGLKSWQVSACFLKNRSLEHRNFFSSQIVREAFSLFPELCLGFRRGSVHGTRDRIGSQKIEKHGNLCTRGEALILKSSQSFTLSVFL